MVGVAQLAEHWTVVPMVGGSSPLTHPFLFFEKIKIPLDSPVKPGNDKGGSRGMTREVAGE